MRRLVVRGFSAGSVRSKGLRITNVFENPESGEGADPRDPHALPWMKFFTDRGSAQIDLDRSLINREDTMDEFSRRFILKNYTQFSTYQLLRSIYFLSRSSDKFQFLWQLKTQIALGDWKLEAEDAVLLAKDLQELLQSDELLMEFSLYQIASNFDTMDLISKFYALEFQLNCCKVSEQNLKNFQTSLSALGGEKQFQEYFKSRSVQEQLLVIQVLACFERNSVSTVNLLQLVEIVGFEGLTPQNAGVLSIKEGLAEIVNYQQDYIKRFEKTIFVLPVQLRVRYIECLQRQ